MTEQAMVKIRFPGLESGDAGSAAQSLREQIEDELPDAHVHISKDNADTLDFGSTLVVALGTPAVIMLAKGIAKWLARERTELEIEIDSERIKIRASGTLDENAARIVEAIHQIKPTLK